MTDFEFNLGDRVVIEVSGRVVEQRSNPRGALYVVQPDNPRLPRVHAPAETVFGPDDDSEPAAVVVPFPVPAIMQ